MKTLVASDPAALHEAAEILNRGGLVAVPTETVYGLSAHALRERAVEDLYECKGRPRGKPISLLVRCLDQARVLCRDIPTEAEVLAARFWPGPLTLVLKKSERVSDIVSAGLDTVGIRCPDHALTLRLLELVGAPLATPSANPSGKESPKSAAQVLTYFDGVIPMILDGGNCTVGVESTIVDLTGPVPKILRQGGLPRAELEAALGREVLPC